MSDQTLTLDEAMQLVSEAFLPCGCVTSANADEDSFSLTVMDGSGDEVMHVAGISRNEYHYAQQLGSVIEQARFEVEDRGHRLEPWTMPSLTDDTGIPETPPNY